MAAFLRELEAFLVLCSLLCFGIFFIRSKIYGRQPIKFKSFALGEDLYYRIIDRIPSAAKTVKVYRKNKYFGYTPICGTFIIGTLNSEQQEIDKNLQKLVNNGVLFKKSS